MENIIQTAIQNQEMIIAIIALVMSIIATWLTISLYRKFAHHLKKEGNKENIVKKLKIWLSILFAIVTELITTFWEYIASV